MNKADLRQKIGNLLYMLLIFLFVADPTGTILHAKNPVFALFFCYNLALFRADWSKLIYFIIPVVAVTASWVIAMMRGVVVDPDELKGVYTAFLPMLLLMWNYRYDVIKLSIVPVVFTAAIVLLLFWIIFFVPKLEHPIYVYMMNHGGTIMMTNRYFIGVKLFCMYPKSAVAFLPVFGWTLFNLIKAKKYTLANVLPVAILLHMFLISGTRSSILLPVLLAAVILFVYCRNRRYVNYIMYPAFAVFLLLFVVLLVMLLSESNEFSNMVKYAHLQSYLELFAENPQYLLIGQGPATDFYSKGFNVFTLKTEWTYLEILRNYGLLSIPILYVLLCPIFAIMRKERTNDSALAMVLTYLIYLVIAGTNPLLLSSTGMLVLLSMYSYVERMEENGCELSKKEC